MYCFPFDVILKKGQWTQATIQEIAESHRSRNESFEKNVIIETGTRADTMSLKD
jgi:hypothetical protein